MVVGWDEPKFKHGVIWMNHVYHFELLLLIIDKWKYMKLVKFELCCRTTLNLLSMNSIACLSKTVTHIVGNHLHKTWINYELERQLRSTFLHFYPKCRYQYCKTVCFAGGGQEKNLVWRQNISENEPMAWERISVWAIFKTVHRWTIWKIQLWASIIEGDFGLFLDRTQWSESLWKLANCCVVKIPDYILPGYFVA